VLGAIVAALAVVLPILLTRGGPGTHPGAGSTRTARSFTVQLPTDAEAQTVAFSPDGRFLAVGASQTGATYLYNVATGQLAAILKVRGSGSISGVAFSPDGKLLASSSADGQIYLWDVSAGTLAATLKYGGGGPVAFSPDSKLLAASGGDVVVLNVATGRSTRTFKVASILSGVAFSPDGRLLAAAGAPAFIWDVATGQRYAAFYDPTGQTDNDVAFSPDGKVLAAADHNGSTYLWDVASGNISTILVTPNQFPNVPAYVNWVAFSPDGKLLATADADSQAYLWKVATGKLVGKITGSSQYEMWAVAFSPDGRLVAAADGSGTVYIRVVSQLTP
jgi:WD40 repeat protein